MAAVLVALLVVVVLVLGLNAWRTYRTWTSVDRQARRFHEREP